MKKLVIATVLFIGSMSAFTKAHAQVNVTINIGSQPEWGPANYDYVEYYYLPDLDIYYHVPSHQFYYLSGNRWVTSSALPAKYRNYDLYKAHKVVLNSKNAYMNNQAHVKQYAQFKNKKDQQPIRDSKDNRYGQSKNNWQDNKFSTAKANQSNQRNQPSNNKKGGSNNRH